MIDESNIKVYDINIQRDDMTSVVGSVGLYLQGCGFASLLFVQN